MIHLVLSGCQNIVCTRYSSQGVSDRVLEYFSTHLVLMRFKRVNFDISSADEIFNKSEMELFGYIFSSKGLSADPKKINDILNLDASALTHLKSAAYWAWQTIHPASYQGMRP